MGVLLWAGTDHRFVGRAICRAGANDAFRPPDPRVRVVGSVSCNLSFRSLPGSVDERLFHAAGPRNAGTVCFEVEQHPLWTSTRFGDLRPLLDFVGASATGARCCGPPILSSPGTSTVGGCVPNSRLTVTGIWWSCDTLMTTRPILNGFTTKQTLILRKWFGHGKWAPHGIGSCLNTLRGGSFGRSSPIVFRCDSSRMSLQKIAGDSFRAGAA